MNDKPDVLHCTCDWRLIDSGSQYASVRSRVDPNCKVHRPVSGQQKETPGREDRGLE